MACDVMGRVGEANEVIEAEETEEYETGGPISVEV